jgi:hypothetical protein
MTQRDKLPDRIGKALSALDIDFSRFTLAGWVVSLTSLAVGVLVGLTVYDAVPRLNVGNDGPALILGLSVIAATTITFLISRAILARLGISITKPPPGD